MSANALGVDFLLREELTPGAVADIDDFRSVGNHRQNLPADERIVKDNVSASKEARRFQSKQFGIARACADEIDLAHYATHSPRPSFSEYVSVSPQSTKSSAEAFSTSASGFNRSTIVLSGVRMTQALKDSPDWRASR